MIITHTEPCPARSFAAHPSRDPSLHRPALSFSSEAKNLAGRFHSRMTTRRMRSEESGVACSRMTTQGEHGDNPHQAVGVGAHDDPKNKRRERVGFPEASEVELWGFRASRSPTEYDGNPNQTVGTGVPDGPFVVPAVAKQKELCTQLLVSLM